MPDIVFSKEEFQKALPYYFGLSDFHNLMLVSPAVNLYGCSCDFLVVRLYKFENGNFYYLGFFPASQHH